MNQQSFEARVLKLWMTTRVPLTRANILFYTQASRKKAEGWLDEMVREGVLEIDSDDDGEMVWMVRGAKRAERGPTTVDGLQPAKETGGDLAARLGELKSQALTVVEKGSGGLVTAGRAAALMKPGKEGDKSVLAAGLLSFFFGPFGWLYAAPLNVALPAIVLFMVACWLLPAFLISWFAMPAGLLFGLAGAAYAWKHNQVGDRAPLLGAEQPEPPTSGRPRR